MKQCISRKKTGLIAICLLSLFLVACGKNNSTGWQEKYDVGVRMMSEGDTAGAILAFQAAVKLDINKAEGYASLAEAYAKSENFDAAEEILMLGLARCGETDLLTQANNRVKKQKEEWIAKQTTSGFAEQPTTSEHAKDEDAGEAVLNNALFKDNVFFSKETITQISFLDSLDTATENAWDFSKTMDGRVLIWLDGTHLYVAGDGGIYLDTDASGLFENCTALKVIHFGTLNTSLVTDMESMFMKCSALTEVDISGFDTSGVTDMSSMFWDCKALTNLNVSGFDTSNVTDMGGMFAGCRQLIKLEVDGFRTSKVTQMQSMFRECYNLQELDVSGFDTSNVTVMNYMFMHCESLAKLDLSGFDTSAVTEMDAMFNYCKKLTELDLHGFNTSEVTSMYAMFSMCSSLVELDVSHFQTGAVTDMRDMFAQCRMLKKVDVSGFDTASVTRMGGMFQYCIALEEVDVSHFDTSNIEDKFTDLRSYLRLD